MSLFDRLKKIFNNPQADAEKRVSALIAQQCDWFAIESQVFPEKGVGPRLSAVLDAIIESKNWKLLTPLITRAGDYLDTVNLVYRQGEYGQPPATRVQELEDIYQAISTAPKNAAKVTQGFINCVESWACQHNAEDCFDWASKKPEFGPIPALGLAALCDNKIDGNPFAMKVIKTAADIEKAIDAVEWIYKENAADRYAALDNLEDWRKVLESKNNKKPAPPTP